MRRIVLLLAGLAVLVASIVAFDMRSGGTGPKAKQATSSRPSIVFILTDDQRIGTMRAMPNTRALIEDKGVRFTNAFVSNPMCCPSRATILTGKYSHDNGVWRNFQPSGGFESFKDTSTVATWLDPTYSTAIMGKYLNHYAHHLDYVAPGWDQWYVLDHVAYYDYAVSDDGHAVNFGSKPADYSTNVLAQHAVDFIHKTQGPLFLYFAPIAPHRPSIPYTTDAQAFPNLKPFRSPSYAEADVSDKPPYIRNRTWTQEDVAATDQLHGDMLRTLIDADRAIGRVVQALSDTGRLSNTLIIFMSDNGWLWGEHRWSGKSVPYEESIRVPMAMRWDDGGIKPGTVDDHMVDNADIAPTIADAAGVAAPGADGRSLLPLLKGAETSWRTSFPLEHMVSKFGGPARAGPSYCGVRTQRYTYVRYAGGFQEVYDLEADPWELTNISASKPGLTAKLRAMARTECNPPPPGYSWSG